MSNSVLLLVMLVAMALMLTRGDQVSWDVDDLFNEYDDDGDGLVAPEEIENHLSAAMVTINNYVMTYDSDNDGKLNSEEFAKFAAFANIQDQ